MRGPNSRPAARELLRRAGSRKEEILRHLGGLSKGLKKWSELKSFVEMKEGRRISNQIFDGLLSKLVRSGFVHKNEKGEYSIADPLLGRAVRSGLF